MSIATDSPIHSSSSDEFAAFLDAQLDSISSESFENEISEGVLDSASLDLSHDEEIDEDDVLEYKRCKRVKIDASEGTTAFDGPVRSMEQNWEASSSIDTCSHPGSFGEMCILCGQRIDENSGLIFGYIHKDLRLGNAEINRLRYSDMKNLLRQKKLYLVLDLDHTLLNSTQLVHLTSDEQYLKSQASSSQDDQCGSLFQLDFMHMVTKLRPFVRPFLNEASQMFEMYIYTMGDRAYANEMAKLLDPNKEYFSSRVISRDDGNQRHQKGLDLVLGQENAVLILDDTENAWIKHKENLILMERYHFFASSCHQFGFNCRSLSELRSDESEAHGALASVLKVLTKIHHLFFNEVEDDDLEGRDVRQVLKRISKEVLRGCTIIFSRVFPTQFQAENHALWRMAERLGASCRTEVSPSVTHVVSTDPGTEKSRWAVKNNRFLVHPRWIEAASFLWRKQPEESFSLNLPKG